MNLTIHQSIMIQQLRVEAVTNSSVLQIGTAGRINALSNLYNSGSFTGPAPTLSQGQPPLLVPLPSPH